MALKKIDPTSSKYTVLWEALKPSLVSREHEEPTWAALGEEQFYYTHTCAEKAGSVTSTTTSLQGKAAGKGNLALLTGQFLYNTWLGS